MTTSWIVINIALAAVISALVAGVSVFVPLRLHRHATAHTARSAARREAVRTQGYERQAA